MLEARSRGASVAALIVVGRFLAGPRGPLLLLALTLIGAWLAPLSWLQWAGVGALAGYSLSGSV
jgi:hypothetical protein